MQVVMCLVHPCHGSLFPSTVNSMLALVNTIHIHSVWAFPKYLSATWECHQPSSKYRLCRTAAPCGWSPSAASYEVFHVIPTRVHIFHTQQLLASLGGC